MQQVGDPHRDHPGLTGPGPGQYEKWSLCTLYRRLLLGVKIEEASHTSPERELRVNAIRPKVATLTDIDIFNRPRELIRNR
ncbi:MAG: hypothetical protein WAM44_09485, partial [Chthoniobacterales bacterium]